VLVACGDAGSSEGSGGAGAATSSGAGGGGGAAAACEPSFDGDTLHLAASATVASGDETTVCLRWTTPETIEVSGLVGTLGPLGHHALLMTQASPTEPDGLAPCSEAELMDATAVGSFQMLAGVSYESSGTKYDFPTQGPYQIGLKIPKGTQLIFDAHFLNAGGSTAEGCATLDLDRGKAVDVALLFRTVLPQEEYGLVVPANGTETIDVSEPAGASYRIAAASSHMHAGGTHFRMSIAETDQTLYETTTWSDPVPRLFDTQKIVVDGAQTFRLECSFENTSDTDQHFPDQMCVGGMYLLPCTTPGAC
jgi:hypothetical protein